MKNMGLIDKIKKGAVALGLAGTLAFSGCELSDRPASSIEPGPLYPRILQNKPINKPERNNRTEQNREQEENHKNFPDNQYFVCNEVKDTDGNGDFDYPFDFIDIKNGNNAVDEGHKFAIVGIINDPRAYMNNVDLIIINKKTNDLLYKEMRTVDKKNYVYAISADTGVPGEYLAYWRTSVKKIPLGQINYKIIEKDKLSFNK